MKRIILSMIAVMTFAFVGAQDVKYGVKGGLNVSNFFGDTDGVDLRSRVGFNIGGFVEVKLSEKFALQPELLYSTQGAKFANVVAYVDGYLYTGDVKFNLGYINVPVMFKYYGTQKFSVEAGPQIGFLISAKSKTKLDGFSRINELDAKDYFKSIDFGINFGAGYDFTENVSVGARYNLGLVNSGENLANEGGKTHNGVFSLSLGYKF